MMNPVMFNLFGIEIRWYSVLILLGIIIGLILAEKEAKKKDISKEFIDDLAFYAVIFGILGARLYYVIFNFSLYKNDLLSIFKVWNGGLAIHGGIIGGLLVAVYMCRKHKVELLKVTDIGVISLIIAQAIGRWGNFFNSEAHGPITTLANLESLHIPSFIIKGMQINGVYYHPTFFYESLWCIGGFLLLVAIRKFFKYLKNGQLTCVYLMWYSLGRFCIESLRTDSLMIGVFKVAQLVSVLLFFIGLVGFILLIFFNKRKVKTKK